MLAHERDPLAHDLQDAFATLGIPVVRGNDPAAQWITLAPSELEQSLRDLRTRLVGDAAARPGLVSFLVEAAARGGRLDVAVELIENHPLPPAGQPLDRDWGLAFFNVGWAARRAGRIDLAGEHLARAALADPGLAMVAVLASDRATRDAVGASLDAAPWPVAYAKDLPTGRVVDLFLGNGAFPLSDRDLAGLSHDDRAVIDAARVAGVLDAQRRQSRAGRPCDTPALLAAVRDTLAMPLSRWLDDRLFQAVVLVAAAHLLAPSRLADKAIALARFNLRTFGRPLGLTTESIEEALAGGQSLLEHYCLHVVVPELGAVEPVEDRGWKHNVLVALSAFQALASGRAFAQDFPDFRTPPRVTPWVEIRRDGVSTPGMEEIADVLERMAAGIRTGTHASEGEDPTRSVILDPVVSGEEVRKASEAMDGFLEKVTPLEAIDGNAPGVSEVKGAVARERGVETAADLARSTRLTRPDLPALSRIPMPRRPQTTADVALVNAFSVLSHPDSGDGSIERAALEQVADTLARIDPIALTGWAETYGDPTPVLLYARSLLAARLGADALAARHLEAAVSHLNDPARGAASPAGLPDLQVEARAVLATRMVLLDSLTGGTGTASVLLDSEDLVLPDDVRWVVDLNTFLRGIPGLRIHQQIELARAIRNRADALVEAVSP